MVTDEQLSTFCDGVAALRSKHNFGAANIIFERGRKNARIVVDDGVSRSAWGFVDLATGNLLKADGWKAPARGVRGNILSDDPLAGCGPSSPAYRR